MKISYLIFLISCFGISAFAQQSEVRQVGSFQGIKAMEGVDVYLKKGDKESVKVESSGDLSDVLTEITGSTLKIHMRDQYRFGKGRPVKVYVTYVKVDRISASSAANIFSQDVIKSTDFTISISSAGTVEVSLEAETVRIEASSAGNSVLEGKTKILEIEASSAGEIDAYRLESEKASARTSSGGTAKINVTKELEAHASSGGTIRYRGNPVKTNTDSSSGGVVKKTGSTSE